MPENCFEDVQYHPLGQDVVRDLKLVVMQQGVFLLFYGIQTTLLTAAVSSLTRQRTWSRPVTACVVALFLSSTCEISVNAAIQVLQMPQLGSSTRGLSPELFTRLNIVFIVFTRFNYVMSDTIVVWRVWRLWRDSLLAKSSLLLCLLGSLVGVLLECVLYIKAPVNGLQSSAIMMEIPLLITNSVSTVLVGIKLWYYLRTVKPAVSESRKPTWAEKILILLLESGTIYCFLWAVRFAIDLDDSEDASVTYAAYSVMGAAYPSIAGILPTLILLAVALQRSATSSLLSGTQMSHRIQFADATELQDRSSDATDDLTAINDSTYLPGHSSTAFAHSTTLAHSTTFGHSTLDTPSHKSEQPHRESDKSYDI
ncbi:hypothetical protein HDZ31DRAFT_59961 [Schizophyllum fasciatum]